MGLTIAKDKMDAKHDIKELKWIKITENHENKIASKFHTQWEFGERADSSHRHECTFYVKELGLDKLEETVNDLSNPKSKNYGKYLSKEKVEEMTKNPIGMNVVRSYILNFTNVTITKETTSTITANTNIENWEKMLNTQFFNVSNLNLNEGKEIESSIVRCKEYSLPAHIVEHVKFVTGTTQLPVALSKGPIISRGPIVKPMPMEIKS
eukprot:gene8117-10993_t